MGVPEDIRKVPRPPNTVVVENKCDGPKRYGVRARVGVKYVPGGNPQPINGGIIGHIFEGRFVPVKDEPATSGPDSRSYGAAAFAKRESGDFMDDLLGVMDIDYAMRAYTAALLKTIKPGIKAKRMTTEYNRTFVGHWFPGIDVSRNAMTDLYRRIGMDGTVRAAFATARLRRVAAGHHLIIDGMLKEDNSSVNDLSGYTFKSREKGIRNISVIFAYDLEDKEIICSEVFPGNEIDASAYSAFIRDNDIRSGILVTDKGFPPSKISKELDERPDLHFITPLKRNDTRIRSNDMLQFTGLLPGYDSGILYKKVELKGGRFLYSFRDPGKAAIEEASYLRRIGGGFDNGRFSEKKEQFGTITFLSDVDLRPEDAYAIYSERWVIEMVFRFYKNDLDLAATNVHDDFTVIGEEFVNLIAAGITCRMLKSARESGLLGEMSFGDILDDLSGVWRRTDCDAAVPGRDSKGWVHPFEYALDEMVALNLAEGDVKTETVKGILDRSERRKNPDKPPRKRGRPRKSRCCIVRYLEKSLILLNDYYVCLNGLKTAAVRRHDA